ncbi:MAG: methylcrotonoyl-CoA carboxylase, partial [Blastomonas fulva]|uniref:biotin/lipoyl-containing protein n=1 Tax=Blastomonas fulva TaxID=1550728 RepID=UPI0024E1B781
DRIFFMEMNTRLQVEHPVTEEITGVDLVEWQLRVASGEPLPKRQDELSINGHAIEARLYAEDPAKGFLPSTGRLEVAYLGEDYCRIDTGVEVGAEISPFYDPMIAKIIYHAEDRETAIDGMWRACAVTAIAPVRSNAWFLHRLLALDEFQSGEMTTGTIGTHIDALTAEPKLSAFALQDAAYETVIRERWGPDRERIEGLAGFRLNAERRTKIRLLVNGEEALVPSFAGATELVGIYSGFQGNAAEGLRYENGAVFRVSPYRHEGTGQASAADGAIIAPMPGKVIAVDVSEGQAVTAGQRLMVLEAMKMEHALTAPFDGVIERLAVSAGGQVQVEAVLAKVLPIS